MSTANEVLVVEAQTQYGFKSGGRNYGISPRLKEAGITPQHFGVGLVYQCEVYTGPKGGKSVNSFGPFTNGVVPVSTPSLPPLPPVPPALPPTTVTATPAPGGIPPVTPAQKRTEGDSEKMTKADWAEKDRTIQVQAIAKSSIESPALAQLIVGKRLEEAIATKREWFKSSLKDYMDALNGTL